MSILIERLQHCVKIHKLADPRSETATTCTEAIAEINRLKTTAKKLSEERDKLRATIDCANGSWK